MLRGTTLFRCPNCGHVFEAPDIEDNATVRTTPMPCPRCGTKSNPIGILGWLNSLIGKSIRKSDEN